MSNSNGDSRAKFSQTHRFAQADISAASTNPYAFSQDQHYQQLIERMRELEEELLSDAHHSQIPSTYSALTPSSTRSAGGSSGYTRPYSFPINLLSPQACAARLQFGLSPRVFERAHQIPERFWIDWQQKQMQQRIDELELFKNNSIVGDSSAMTRRRSLPKTSVTLHTTISSSIDDDISSSDTSDDLSLFNFDQRSLNEVKMRAPSRLTSAVPSPSARQPQSTLDRSRLTIFLPFSNNTHQPSSEKPLGKETCNTKVDLASAVSAASSIEDVAKIDTELNLMLLSRVNFNATTPILYSKAVINRTIEFRSLTDRTRSLSKQ